MKVKTSMKKVLGEAISRLEGGGEVSEIKVKVNVKKRCTIEEQI